MIYPSINKLSDEGVNRYMLSIATAKCARRITGIQLEKSQAFMQEMKDDKFASGKKLPSAEKPVKEAINKLYTREYKIVQS